MSRGCFIAWIPSNSTRSLLVEKTDDIKHQLNQMHINWTHSSDYHMTLHYYHTLDNQLINAIIQSLNKEELFCAPKGLVSYRLGLLGQVLVIFIKSNKLLNKQFKYLSNPINQDLFHYTNGVNQHDFKPHITIGKIKALSPQDVNLLDMIVNKNNDKFINLRLSFKELGLYQSQSITLPRYTTIWSNK